jgi:hypothetical protein
MPSTDPLTSQQEITADKIALQKLHDNKDWEGIKKFPAPRPRIILTIPHLVEGTARAVREHSPVFKPYVYSGNASNPKEYGEGIETIHHNLESTNEIFSTKNELVRNIVVIYSYNTLQRRNRKGTIRKWLQEKYKKGEKKLTNKSARQESKKFSKYRECPSNLYKLFCAGMLDEVQATKGQNTNTSIAVRGLALPWTLLVTATPTPWKHSDLTGLISFIQDTRTDQEYYTKIVNSAHTNTRLPNPYELTANSKLKFPKLRKYIPTASAYAHHVCPMDGKISDYNISQCMGLIFQEVGVVRRDYHSTIKVGPNTGDLLRIGDLIPVCEQYHLIINQPNLAQELYDIVAPCFSSSSSGSSSNKTNVPDLAGTPNTSSGGYSAPPTPTQGPSSTAKAANFKGAPNLRIINLIATCPLLAFATSIHKTKTNKMPLEVNLTNSGKEMKYV